MRNDNKFSIKTIIDLLDRIIEGKIVNLEKLNRQNPKIFHYYTEIVRYWSKLNYIFQKTMRSLKKNKIAQNERPIYIYLIYRIIQENASDENVLKELNLSNNQEINLFLDKLKTFSWKKALKGKSKREKLSIQEAVSTFFIDHLLPVMKFELIEKNIKSMNDHQNYNNYVRINTLKSKLSNHELIQNLKKELIALKIPIKQDKNIPELFYIPNNKKRTILKSRLYLSGDIIFQDKASVAVVKVLSPKSSEFICDICAAPGNKTNLISQYTANQAQIIASEFLTVRARKMSKLIHTPNYLKIHIINTDSIQFPLRFGNQYDRILLDAPCTGSGAFITNPELKRRQNNDFLHQNITLQKKLIESALRILKLDGIFVYSTCSLYPEEGELQILKFLDKLEPLQIPKWFSPSYRIKNRLVKGTGRLFPSIHHTQGFFIAKFKKKEE